MNESYGWTRLISSETRPANIKFSLNELQVLLLIFKSFQQKKPYSISYCKSLQWYYLDKFQGSGLGVDKFNLRSDLRTDRSGSVKINNFSRLATGRYPSKPIEGNYLGSLKGP
jgi:hypothetical protein